MNTSILTLSIFLLLLGITNARPQDLGTGVMLAVGQMQQLMETGGGLKNEQSVEILGERFTGGLTVGIGEVMGNIPMGGGRR
ncbi:uncharacterized protein LOC108088722 isoform X2 [Drosophila ficusphila]|uniref:uncharacterized protein LOC108088722 isoform X2 n=1 Tax=Drosophila ficusphila TaxID=30025 RepID=UPI001C8A7893|nr:uncharacterized protein LOC108088722 isoform X2 [Drosophila ficusphila]